MSSRADFVDRFHELSEDELSFHIQLAGPTELDLLLHHPKVTEKQVLLVLRNKHVTPKMLAHIASDRRFTASYAVRHHLVLNPRTPRHVAVRFVKFLYLAHLVKLLDDHQVMPGVRRHGEALLLQRLPQITLGERITMARTGGRGVIQALRTETEMRVVGPLLENPRTTTADVVTMMGAARAPIPLFEEIAGSRRWSRIYQVRLALAKNARVPRGLALGSLSSLLSKDLRDIEGSETVARLVRLAARRVLDARAEQAMGVS